MEKGIDAAVLTGVKRKGKVEGIRTTGNVYRIHSGTNRRKREDGYINIVKKIRVHMVYEEFDPSE